MNRINSLKWTSLALTLITISLSCSERSSNNNRTEIVLDSALMIPDFVISTVEDSTTFSSSDISKDGLILLKYFSPDCDHCQNEAVLYLSKKDSLQNIKTIWVTGNWAPMDSIREFTDIYGLQQINPIAIGKESYNSLISYYKFEGIPYNALYKDNQLIKEYPGSVDFSELISISAQYTFLDKNQ
ncbi:MAG: hypothetical protein AAF789_04430 [Bacteroidota bacterium]